MNFNVYKLTLYSIEYYEKSRHLQDRLKELKCEIEVLKVEDKQTSLDRIYEENQQQGV